MGKKAIKALRDEINYFTKRLSECNIELNDKRTSIIELEIVLKNIRKENEYFRKVLELSKDSKIMVVNELTKDNIKEYLKGDRDESV